jgi:glucose/arabinose dehydrogenase
VVVLSPWGEHLVTYTEPNDGHAGAFSGPRDVAVEPDGDLVVVDSGNRRVVTVRSAAPAYSRVWLPAAMRAVQK